MAATRRHRLAGSSLGPVLGAPRLWHVLRQCWLICLDQRAEAEHTSMLVTQLQQMTLSGGAGWAPPDDAGPGGDGEGGASPIGPLPPGIPMMPGVTGPAFPGGTAGPFGGAFAPPAAPTAPPGASLLGDLGASAGVPSAMGGGLPDGGPAAAGAQAGGPAAAVQGGAVKAQALEVKELLEAFGAAKATDFQWVKRLLMGFGYVGEQTMTAPRKEEMAAALEPLAAQAALSTAGGPWSGGAVPSLAAAQGGAEETRWGPSLPADLQRAGPEINRAIRGEGSTSVPDWIAQRCQGSRSSPEWVDLWTLATSIDFRLRDCKSGVELMQLLAGDDMMGKNDKAGRDGGAPSASAQDQAAHLVGPAGEVRSEAVWVPGMRDDSSPTLKQVISARPGQEALLLITPVCKPRQASSRSSRLRHRYKRKLAVWVLANDYVRGINSTDTGSCKDLTRSRHMSDLSDEVRGLQDQIHRVALREAKRLAEARRDLGLTGVQAVLELARVEEVGNGKPIRLSSNEALRAASVDEPSVIKCVQRLDALSPEEAQYYSLEENVMERDDLRGRVLFEELQEKFGFVGGAQLECERYLGREDLSPNLWHFGGLEEAKAIAGCSTAGKKSGDRQRKIIMTVAAS
ncbi:unnamed protein product [Prorocentrum cordatum]|uniref:Uncharacterized protein n=1 Tax=Prorocentrum cordatum TaxID=2364126 RepID=A0ABN9TDR0_9DINO|nr:unnamed protein product [Polarella glacialis]